MRSPLYQRLFALTTGLLLLLAFLPAVSRTAVTRLPNQLESLEAQAGEGRHDLILHFSKRPEFLRKEIDNRLVLILDFPDTVFPGVRSEETFEASPLRSYSVLQFAHDQTRLVLKLSRQGRVEVFRKQDGHRWTLRFQVAGTGTERPAVLRGKRFGQRESSRREALVGRVKRSLSRKPAPPPSLAEVIRPRSGRPVVLIDPGHGGKDAGTSAWKIREKDLVLEIALEAKKLFDKDKRVDARFTRLDDRFVSLRDRTRLAHDLNANLFVSIHANSTPKGRPEGFEVYRLSRKGATDEAARLLAERENSAGGYELPSTGSSIVNEILGDMIQTNTYNKSTRFAELVGTRWTRATGQRFRGVKKARFTVLRTPSIPSVLLEVGFLSTPKERARMSRPSFARQGGKVIYESVLAYLEESGQLRRDVPVE